MRHGFETECENCGAKGELRWKENDAPFGSGYEYLIKNTNLIVVEHWRSEPDWRGKVACEECGEIVWETAKP